MMNHTSSYVAGQDSPSSGRATMTLVNPATDADLAELVLANESDVDDAVTAAAAGQREWLKLSVAERADVLWRFSLLLDEHAADLAALDTTNTGKAIREARSEGAQLGPIARYWAGSVDKILGQQIPTRAHELSFTRREAVGVVAAITPWNAPAVSTVHRIASAVACGNGVIVKPSEHSPLSSRVIAGLTVAAGMPTGLVNILVGDGKAGHALASHPGVGAVRFTGGIATGQKIAHAAADTFKKITLELGGKSPNIVFDDADIEAALRGSLWGIFANTGQICCAGSRLVVHEKIADEFVTRLAAMAARVRVGDPFEESNHIGPLAFRQQYERVLSFIDIAKNDGARVEVGGGRPDALGERGCFIAPTILTEVQAGSRIAQEEVFGPVLSVTTFAGDDEAIEIANGTVHGLATILWTQNQSRSLRMSEAIEAGNVWVNTARAYGPTLPFSGFKASGVGNAMAEGAIEGCTRVKRVTIAYGDARSTPGWDDL
jgi:acyl-CoA reductase-like NAD-dependent aldehyde dehydrogenase